MTHPPSQIGAETLSAYLEQGMQDEQRAEIEAELEHNPATARELAELQTMLSAMASMPQLAAPRGFSERLGKSIRRRRWLENMELQGQAAMIFQILSIIVVIGIATTYMIAQMETDDRRVMQIEAHSPAQTQPK